MYDEVKKEIIEHDCFESEEIIKYLAKEFLIENSMWHAYQNQNNPDWII